MATMSTQFELVWMCGPMRINGPLHQAIFTRNNPETIQHVSDGTQCGHVGRMAWRNCDKNIREWWKTNGNSVKTEMVVTAEYDVVINCDLSKMVAPSPGVGCRASVDKVFKWMWFSEAPKLKHLRQHATGIAPLAFLVWNRETLDAICDPDYDWIFEEDVFCELRLGTVVRASGHQINSLPYTNYVRAAKDTPLRPLEHGIWHPVKKYL